MLNMLKTFYGNLSKGGKIILWVFLQTLVVIILALAIHIVFQSKTRIEIENGGEVTSAIPDEYMENFKKTLWELISSNVDNIDKNVIDDVVIRDGTYEEVINENVKSVNFIIDIDSIKQTFAVSIGWSENSKDGPDNNVSIECPPVDEMKYPETVCYGMYNNTYSLDLYLPHTVYPEGSEDDGVTAPNYMITGDESTKTLDIMVSACNAEKFKQEAWDYLDNKVPIDFSNYTVNYDINSINVEC